MSMAWPPLCTMGEMAARQTEDEQDVQDVQDVHVDSGADSDLNSYVGVEVGCGCGCAFRIELHNGG